MIIISLVHRIYEIYKSSEMIHPWKKLIEEIRDRNWTQKQFAVLVWKKNSEVNELIKWKRNITIQWDLILSEVLWTPEKYWINMQTDYDYEIAKQEREKEKNENKQEFEIVWDIEQEYTKETKDSENRVVSDVKQETQEDPQKLVVSLPEKEEIVEDQPEEKENISQDVSSESDEPNEEEKHKKKEVQKVFLNF